MSTVITVKLKTFGDILELSKYANKCMGKIKCQQDDWIVSGKSSLGIASLDTKQPINLIFDNCSDAEIAQFNKWKIDIIS